ncbi:mannose-6-phosphate isomerase [Bacteroidales bacterium]|nr:mannose-6-phosphate isomerase [Bacteroidales bacterium]
MRKSNYDKFPTTKISGFVLEAWNSIIEELKKCQSRQRILAVDFYVGLREDEIIEKMNRLSPDLFINTRDLFKSNAEILAMTHRFMSEDVLFGFVTNLSMLDYFDKSKLQRAKTEILNCKGKVLIVGSGASLLITDTACLVYADMSRWEILERFRKNEVCGLGIDNREEAFSLQYKRGYFNDWKICDAHKDRLFARVDYWLDTHKAAHPKLIDKETFFKGIEQTIKSPFRVVPFFAPAPWGGQWMKETCDLDRNEINYGWCFDCVPEENSLLFEVNGIVFEIPSIDLVLLQSRALLGEPVESRFGKEFPIRFDFLDTIEGGNLSLQVHPTTQYVRENFGLQYTQDESYYMVEAAPDAIVYLGLKDGVDKNQMIGDLRKAQNGELVFDAEKYANKIPAKKHDHFLIPAGTVHCSGAGAMVLEISATPNLFTFKLWDWQRLGLDQKPRPINIERGKEVIDWARDTQYTYKNLVNTNTQIAEGEGWMEEKTGLHPNEFIETRRHRFSIAVTHKTKNSVNVLNLVEGEEAVVESPNNLFDPFVVHYAETFIIPADIKEYTIRPYGKSIGSQCVTIKAYVRTK